jgi:histidinol-phosphatase (PHP family)
MHTPLCHHAVGEPVAYAARAAELGLDEIGFSEHSPMPRDDFDKWHMYLGRLDDYVANVEAARRAFPQLKIKLALEVDFIPGHEDWIRSLAKRHEWDYLIGSVHYVSESWDLDNPEKLSEWRQRDPFQVWSVYFERLAAAAASGLFDIIGHADLPKKFCFYPKEDCGRLYRQFLESTAAAGICVELNTAGLRKECREIYPNPEILRIARELGVPITFGSDAHAPGEVGHAFHDAIALAKSIGYTESQRFTGRRREAVPLP